MKTRINRKNNPERVPSSRRKLPHIYADTNRLDEKLIRILEGGDERMTVYVYRAKDDHTVPPYLRKCHPYTNLEADIRDEYGGGEYAIIIRRGETMIFSGVMAIGVPLNWRPRK